MLDWSCHAVIRYEIMPRAILVGIPDAGP